MGKQRTGGRAGISSERRARLRTRPSSGLRNCHSRNARSGDGVSLDTNAWIVYLKSPTSKIRDRLEALDPRDVFVCSVVKAELFHGALKYGNPTRRMSILQELFAPYSSAPFDDRAALAYGTIRHDLERVEK
ncbi:MAG TPA: type II toxin-antitoxin system VapC family toxin [Verrucomicrobiae bacterium]|nr:type II toxin-antitoxin system VapC family toxin [Verrucomicrobiae bacterium]